MPRTFPAAPLALGLAALTLALSGCSGGADDEPGSDGGPSGSSGRSGSAVTDDGTCSLVSIDDLAATTRTGMRLEDADPDTCDFVPTAGGAPRVSLEVVGLTGTVGAYLREVRNQDCGGRTVEVAASGSAARATFACATPDGPRGFVVGRESAVVVAVEGREAGPGLRLATDVLPDIRVP